MLFDVDRLDDSHIYKLMTATVIPRPIAWVVSRGAAGRLNAAPFSFFNVMSGAPPVVCIGVGVRDGMPKDTARNAIETGEFVVNLVPRSLVEAMNLTAADFAADVDELALAGLRTEPSARIGVPRIAGSPVAFECTLMQHLDLGRSRMLLVGSVVAVQIEDRFVKDADRCHVDALAMDLVARMHGPWYCMPGAPFELPRLGVDEAFARAGAAPPREGEPR